MKIQKGFNLQYNGRPNCNLLRKCRFLGGSGKKWQTFDAYANCKVIINTFLKQCFILSSFSRIRKQMVVSQFGKILVRLVVS